MYENVSSRGCYCLWMILRRKGKQKICKRKTPLHPQAHNASVPMDSGKLQTKNIRSYCKYSSVSCIEWKKLEHEHKKNKGQLLVA